MKTRILIISLFSFAAAALVYAAGTAYPIADWCQEYSSQCNTGSVAPVSCPSGYSAPAGSDSISDCVQECICPAGTDYVGYSYPDMSCNSSVNVSKTVSDGACTATITCDESGSVAFHITNDVCICNAGFEMWTIKTAPGETFCGRCSEGYYCPNGTTYGTICPVGHYCPEGSSAPSPCAAGRFRAETGGISADDCYACGVNYAYSGSGAEWCTWVNAGEYTAGGSAYTRTSAYTCPPDYYCPGPYDGWAYSCPDNSTTWGTYGADSIDYCSCDYDWQDCDSSMDNGCETPIEFNCWL
jgi:hypothetical protein